jgi:hypothetical protein
MPLGPSAGRVATYTVASAPGSATEAAFRELAARTAQPA